VQRLADLLGSGEPEMADLVDADRLDVAVAGLRGAEMIVGLRSTRRLDGVEGVGLPLPAASLAVRAVDLDHLHTRRAQQAGQARPVAASALHPDPDHRPEPAQPAEQLVLARTRGCELRYAEQAADRVERSSDMHIEVGVHAAGHPARSIYSCHSHPFLRMVKGWHSPLEGGGGAIVLLAQDDPPYPTGRYHRPSRADGSF
jgi:hypothetical protein